MCVKAKAQLSCLTAAAESLTHCVNVVTSTCRWWGRFIITTCIVFTLSCTGDSGAWALQIDPAFWRATEATSECLTTQCTMCQADYNESPRDGSRRSMFATLQYGCSLPQGLRSHGRRTNNCNKLRLVGTSSSSEFT